MHAMVLDKISPIKDSPLQWREVDDPHPGAGAGEVRVKVRCCAVCRTDLHIVEGDLEKPELPRIPGHQVVGEVDQLGEGCDRLKQGQRIGIAWLRHTDGTCVHCRRGRENLCGASRYTGYDADGGYAEYAVVPEDYAYELPGGMDDVAVSPLLCGGLIGYRALNRAAVPEGGTLLLIGFGSSAHIVLPIALHRGHRVLVMTRSENHQKLARDMGAEWSGDGPRKLPRKSDSAILFAPSGKLVPVALEALDRGGTLSIAGIHLSPIPGLDYQKHLFQERQVRSVTANTREDERNLLAEAVEAGVRPTTTTYALRDANRALQEMKDSAISGTGVLIP